MGSAIAVFCLFSLTAPACVEAAQAGEPEDGIYVWREQGPGPRLRRNDGAEIFLGERVGKGLGRATLFSMSNANNLYRLELKNAGPLEKAGVGARLAVVINGVCLGVYSQSDLHADGTLDLGAQIYGAGAAQKVAERFKLEVPRRKHPGHRFEVRFSPEKETYAVGEPVTLKMELLNTGDVPFSFMNGGQQRGPRDNQFRFLAQRSHGHGKAIPDTGDPNNFGGIAGYVTLRPGESFTKTIALDKWFNFTEPDSYRVTGIFEMALNAAEPERGRLWDELAVGECFVRVVGKAKE
jgi:hypothetical protein